MLLLSACAYACVCVWEEQIERRRASGTRSQSNRRASHMLYNICVSESELIWNHKASCTVYICKTTYSWNIFWQHSKWQTTTATTTTIENYIHTHWKCESEKNTEGEKKHFFGGSHELTWMCTASRTALRNMWLLCMVYVRRGVYEIKLRPHICIYTYANFSMLLLRVFLFISTSSSSSSPVPRYKFSQLNVKYTHVRKKIEREMCAQCIWWQHFTCVYIYRHSHQIDFHIRPHKFAL